MSIHHWRARTVQAVALSLAVFAAPSAALAQTQGSNAVSADARGIVREMQKLIMPMGFIETLRRGLMTRLIADDGLDAEAAARIILDWVLPVYQAHLPDLENTIAGLWTARFTAGDMHGVLTFLRDDSAERQRHFLATPLGQKFLVAQPELATESRQSTAQWAGRYLQLALAPHDAELRGLGIDPATAERLPATAERKPR